MIKASFGPSGKVARAAAWAGAKRWSPKRLPENTMALVSKNCLRCMPDSDRNLEMEVSGGIQCHKRLPN